MKRYERGVLLDFLSKNWKFWNEKKQPIGYFLKSHFYFEENELNINQVINKCHIDSLFYPNAFL